MSTTVERREVVLHGRALSYRQRGEVDSGNPVVVLLHGLASSSSTWREVLGRLPDDVTAIAAKHIDPSRLLAVVVGDRDKLTPSLKALDLGDVADVSVA